MRSLVRATAIAAVVGCNVMSGVNELSLASECTVDCDGGVPDVSRSEDPHLDSGVDSGRDSSEAGKLTCPASFSDCNEIADDGCEVDTRTATAHCGQCEKPCAPGSICSNSACALPPSCKALLAADPTAPSGSYALDPGGVDGGSFSAWCDMTTAGGGWTLVFAPTTYDHSTTSVDYTAPISLVSAATETLLAYRAQEGETVVGTTAVFALPAEWKVAAPFKSQAQDVPISVSIDGVTSAKTLRYGYASFTNYCSDAWMTSETYGRVCIQDSSAPFFNKFAEAGSDNCPSGAELYNAVTCSAARRFTIAVR